MDRPIFSGTLSVLPVGWKQVLKKTWQEKYCLLYKASKSGIDRLEIFDNNEQDSAPRIITLENCIKIEKKSATVFSVITKLSMYDFMATNEDSLQQWVKTLQQVAFKYYNMEDSASVCEDNELYCPSGDGLHEFRVTLHPTEASNRCKLEGKATYVLLLTSNAIKLFEHESQTQTKDDRRLILTWPYCFVRRYGHKDGKFTFEAGRKCDSGEGLFLFDHDNQQEIFRCVSSKMKSMKKMLKESSINSTNKGTPMNVSIESGIEHLNCGENQLQAAMVMEAGSRSPLPPSPTTCTTLHDMDSINQNVTTSSTSYSHSRTETNNISPDVITTKDIPKKPPRKNILNNNSQLNYETIENYDEVEKRENAWKTLGTVDDKHSDHVHDSPADLSMESTKLISDVEYLQSRITRKLTNPVENPITTHAAKMIYSREIPVEDHIYNTYDHLSFFGSTSKLYLTPSNGYKQVIPAPSNNNQTSKEHNLLSTNALNSNDYDEVGVSTVNIGMNTIGVSQVGDMTFEGIRLADDSHLGYAVVRKAIVTKEKDNVLEHRMYNDNPYAVISKPKRV